MTLTVRLSTMWFLCAGEVREISPLRWGGKASPSPCAFLATKTPA